MRLRNPISAPVHSALHTVFEDRESFPHDMILYMRAKDGLKNQIGNKNPFASSVLGPQYQRNADGSYTDVGANPAVDVFDGEKWLRSCGAVTNLLPVGYNDMTSTAWVKRGTCTVGAGNLVSGLREGSGVGDVFRTMTGFSPSTIITPFLRIKRVSDVGVLYVGNPKTAGIGQWEIDLSQLSDAWEIITSDHPAVTEISNWVSHTDGGAGFVFMAYVGEDLSVYVDDMMLTATSYPVPYTPPGTTMPASHATVTNGCWFSNPKYLDKVAGAGVGPCPESVLPPLMVPMEGCTDPLSPNYGSYTYDNVADMCFIPKFYYKANNTLGYTFGTHGANTITIRGSETFVSTAAANIAGFALHRAFIDGGVEHAGFFVDKYKCSKVAKGTGFVAGSVKNGLPLSTALQHNPIAEITAATANAYYACIDAAKGRDGNNGVKNTSSIFAPISVYQRSALALFSLGYGEAADSNEFCAWYDANGVTNYPKGCNNNALRDMNDSQVVYQSDGYSNCGKTGSGTPFERTTHNGQACGVADLNGLVHEVSIGMTCIATSKNITGATQANPCVLTVVGHGLVTGQIIQVTSVVGMTQLNNKLYTVTVIDPDTIILDGVDSTGFTAYASAGSIAYGSFFAAKEATRMRDFTSGVTLATDHWGAVGVAAMMEALALPQVAAAGGSPMDQKFGNAANQVLSADTSGSGYVLTGIGHPKDVNGISTTGTDLFGKDQLYQHFRDQLCVRSGGNWNGGSSAGVFVRDLAYARSSSYSYVGLRCACYPDTTNDPTATPPSILGGKVRSVSPLWKALAGDEVKGSPMTLATRVRIGVGSGDLPSGVVTDVNVLATPSGIMFAGKNDAGVERVVRSYDGTLYLGINAGWTRNSIIRRVTQVNTAGTHFRIGYMIEGTHTAIQWSSWQVYDGSFDPSTLYRLMLGYANHYPMWYNKIAVWNKQMDDAAILEALK